MLNVQPGDTMIRVMPPAGGSPAYFQSGTVASVTDDTIELLVQVDIIRRMQFRLSDGMGTAGLGCFVVPARLWQQVEVPDQSSSSNPILRNPVGRADPDALSVDAQAENDFLDDSGSAPLDPRVKALPAPGAWVARLKGDDDVRPQIAKVRAAHFDEYGMLDLVMYSHKGKKLGRISPAMGGPRNFEPCCGADLWVEIEAPNFRLLEEAFFGYRHLLVPKARTETT